MTSKGFILVDSYGVRVARVRFTSRGAAECYKSICNRHDWEVVELKY